MGVMGSFWGFPPQSAAVPEDGSHIVLITEGDSIIQLSAVVVVHNMPQCGCLCLKTL